jgi:hypothetical protein
VGSTQKLRSLRLWLPPERALPETALPGGLLDQVTRILSHTSPANTTKHAADVPLTPSTNSVVAPATAGAGPSSAAAKAPHAQAPGPSRGVGPSGSVIPAQINKTYWKPGKNNRKASEISRSDVTAAPGMPQSTLLQQLHCLEELDVVGSRCLSSLLPRSLITPLAQAAAGNTAAGSSGDSPAGNSPAGVAAGEGPSVPAAVAAPPAAGVAASNNPASSRPALSRHNHLLHLLPNLRRLRLEASFLAMRRHWPPLGPPAPLNPPPQGLAPAVVVNPAFVAFLNNNGNGNPGGFGHEDDGVWGTPPPPLPQVTYPSLTVLQLELSVSAWGEISPLPWLPLLPKLRVLQIKARPPRGVRGALMPVRRRAHVLQCRAWILAYAPAKSMLSSFWYAFRDTFEARLLYVGGAGVTIPLCTCCPQIPYSDVAALAHLEVLELSGTPLHLVCPQVCMYTSQGPAIGR